MLLLCAQMCYLHHKHIKIDQVVLLLHYKHIKVDEVMLF